MEKNGIYKCEVCGNVVSAIEAQDGTLVCCGQDMVILKEKTSDEGKEKHVPEISISGDKVVINVGSIPHPMEDAHFIELIQVIRNNNIIAEKRLSPGDKPRAEFCLETVDNVKVRILCNVHGLWVS